MEKGVNNISFFAISSLLVLFILLILIIFVTAAGTSTETNARSNTNINTVNATGNNNTNESSINRTRGLERALNASTNRSERAQQVLQILNECEKIDNRTERIMCRLNISMRDREIYKNESRIPEACKRLGANNKQDCIQLHKMSQNCYKLEGRQKDKCFKRVIGFVNSNLNEERSDKAVKARKYIILLLYDLQERIEKKVEAGEISAENGALLIEKLTEIKEDILNNAGRDVIRPKIQEFKQEFRSVMSE
ncbi:MAG: hypothetical protein QXI33_02640 [Candidatus Pacearchaeota archaeon]